MSGMYIDRKLKLLFLVAVVYNIALAMFIEMQTTHPVVVALFLSTDFFLLFYYLLIVFRETRETQVFEKAHADLIEKAREELDLEEGSKK
jgi:uncharacterized membrane protein